MSTSDRETATLMFESAGREITQNFETMNANMALASGTLAALLAVLGAGELFRNAMGNGIPSFSPVSLIVVAAASPLVYRFFFRGLIAYQNLWRFLNIQKQAWLYLTDEIAPDAFGFYVELYWVKWRSPYSLHSLIWQNLKYGFMWVLAVTVATLAWGFYSTAGMAPRLVAGVILLAAAVWETFIALDSRKRYFSVVSQDERTKLEDLRDLPVPHAGDDAGSARIPPIEDVQGLFLGRRRLFLRR